MRTKAQPRASGPPPVGLRQGLPLGALLGALRGAKIGA